MKRLPLLILPVALAALQSCSGVLGETETTTTFTPGAPGGEVVETTRINATVTAIDRTERKITFVTPNNEKRVVSAGDEVVNFDQIRIGDQLRITITEAVVVRMAKPGEKIEDGGTALLGVAPVGDKPGVVTAETYQVTGTVTAIDLKKRKATLQFADGSSKKVKVRKDVDLSKHKVGEKVVIQTTDALAILIEKP